MQKPGMYRAGVYQMRQSELGDPAEPLEVAVLCYFQQQLAGECYKAIDRVIDDFAGSGLFHGCKYSVPR